MTIFSTFARTCCFVVLDALLCTPALCQSKIGIYSPNVGDWLLDANGDFTYGAGDWHAGTGFAQGIPVTGGWNGDGTTKIGVYRNGFWALDFNGNGVWDGPIIDRFYAFGRPNQIPIVGDWNGDGRSKIGVWNAGYWTLDYNGNGQWDGPSGGDQSLAVGGSGAAEQPVIGDWNGDGRSKVGYFNPSSGIWALDYDGNGWDANDKVYYFSQGTGSTGAVGRWSGGRITKIANFNNGAWLVDLNGDGQWDGTALDRSAGVGAPGDRPIVGDWNGNSIDKIGIFRPGGIWALDTNGNYQWDAQDTYTAFANFGDNTVQPVIGKWRKVYTSLPAFSSCLSSADSTCTLAPGTYTVSSPLSISRNNLTVSGIGSASQTLLVRSPSAWTSQNGSSLCPFPGSTGPPGCNPAIYASATIDELKESPDILAFTLAPSAPSQPYHAICKDDLSFNAYREVFELGAKSLLSTPNGGGDIIQIEGMFSVGGKDRHGPDSGIHGCHFNFTVGSNVLKLDSDSGGNTWVPGSTSLGPFGSDLTNPGYCTIHGQTSSLVTLGNTVKIRLDIEFLGAALHTEKQMYSFAVDRAGKVTGGGTWTYWGYWLIP